MKHRLNAHSWLLHTTKWQGQVSDCHDLFKPVILSDSYGLCVWYLLFERLWLMLVYVVPSTNSWLWMRIPSTAASFKSCRWWYFSVFDICHLQNRVEQALCKRKMGWCDQEKRKASKLCSTATLTGDVILSSQPKLVTCQEELISPRMSESTVFSTMPGFRLFIGQPEEFPLMQVKIYQDLWKLSSFLVLIHEDLLSILHIC